MKTYLESVKNYYSSEQRAYVELDAARKFLDKIIEDAVANLNTNLIITGEAGTGKTTLLDQLSLKLVKNKSGIPIFISLKNYSTTLLDLINRSVGRFDTNIIFKNLFSFHKIGNTPFWLLFDGLDEIAPSLYDQFFSELNELFLKNKFLNIVITTRTPFILKGFLQEWKINKIMPLTKKEIINYIGTNLDEKQIEIILSRKDLMSVVHNPLMLSSIIQIMKNRNNEVQYIKKEIAQYHAWRGHTKSFLSPKISAKLLNDILEVIALESILSEQTWLQTSKVKSLIYSLTKDNNDAILNALINMDPIQVDGDLLRFRHKSYQTAYCGRLLLKSLDEIDSFITSCKTIFSKFNGQFVIEDAFLEADLKQKEIILLHLPNNILEHLNFTIPADINTTIKELLENGSYENNFITLFETVKSSLDRNERRRQDIIVFAIHGFNTRGEWKNHLAPILGQETDGERYIFHPWDYGDYKLSILNPFSRRKKVNEFHSFYNATMALYNEKPEICVIAHSFGTYILGNSIKRFPEIKFDRVILLGSVLERNFPWKKFEKKIKKVLNLIGGADIALLLANITPGLGSAGRNGFIDPPDNLFQYKEEYSDHSDLFGSDYMKSIWIPFIRNGKVPKHNQ